MGVVDQVRAVMEGRGLSQVEVAAAAGVTQPAISRWLRGEAEPQAQHIAALAVSLGLNGHWLLTGRGSSAAPETNDPGYEVGMTDAINHIEHTVARLRAILGERRGGDEGDSGARPPRAPDKPPSAGPGAGDDGTEEFRRQMMDEEADTPETPATEAPASQRPAPKRRRAGPG